MRSLVKQSSKSDNLYFQDELISNNFHSVTENCCTQVYLSHPCQNLARYGFVLQTCQLCPVDLCVVSEANTGVREL